MRMPSIVTTVPSILASCLGTEVRLVIIHTVKTPRTRGRKPAVILLQEFCELVHRLFLWWLGGAFTATEFD
jgi:hypothetical protein